MQNQEFSLNRDTVTLQSRVLEKEKRKNFKNRKNNFFSNGSEVLEINLSLSGIHSVLLQSTNNIFRTKIFDMSLLTFRQARDVRLQRFVTVIDQLRGFIQRSMTLKCH